MGGMFGESKYEVLIKVPDEYAARTALVKKSASIDEVLDAMKKLGLNFPVILKPDIGERGFLVEKITEPKQIEAYLTKVNTDFLVQEFVNLPVECGIFYTRFPQNTAGQVTSVVMKEMLTVRGDGRSTLKELILNMDRARLQWETLQIRFAEKLQRIPEADEEIVLNEIGNHCLGTKFLNGNGIINEKLSTVFDDVSKQIDGFYFGRFDLRTSSIEALYEGKFKVMELNGCGAEPAHIYEPGFPLLKALSVQLQHWRNLYQISRENHRRGVEYVPLREGLKVFREFKKAMQ